MKKFIIIVSLLFFLNVNSARRIVLYNLTKKFGSVGVANIIGTKLKRESVQKFIFGNTCFKRGEIVVVPGQKGFYTRAVVLAALGNQHIVQVGKKSIKFVDNKKIGSEFLNV